MEWWTWWSRSRTRLLDVYGIADVELQQWSQAVGPAAIVRILISILCPPTLLKSCNS